MAGNTLSQPQPIPEGGDEAADPLAVSLPANMGELAEKLAALGSAACEIPLSPEASPILDLGDRPSGLLGTDDDHGLYRGYRRRIPT